jgi:hypothetical protein
MAFLYDHTVEELTASTWKKVAIGVLLTLIFHLGDALLGGHLAKTYKINALEIGKVNHLPFCFYKMAKPSLRLCIRHRRMHWPCHWPANAFACGECGVFANSLKRIGKWPRVNAKTIVA